MTHEAGRELDALIAEKVMGWSRCAIDEHGPECDYWWDADGVGHTSQSFSTDIAAAWEVVEKPERDGWAWTLDSDGAGRWHGVVWQGDHRGEGDYEETAPLAICRAALLAVEAT